MAVRPAAPRSRRTAVAAGGDAPLTLPLPFAAERRGDGVLSVTQLVGLVRETLASSVGTHWISGEISNLRVPPSGHVYFTLKDDRAQIAAVMFRGANARLRFRPEDGMEVVVHGSAQVYEARGTLQIIVETMEPRGVGALQLAIEQLKQRLAAEGLFDDARKRPLPYLPACVGIVTALRGAAVHDMIVTMRNRLPGVHILVRPVRVQGDDAPDDIVAGLADLQEHGAADVIVVGRGGGSIEDLWAFNDERVVRAIAACRVPVVSAVGHEVDWTIADLAADRRAATPTAAAAVVVPAARELVDQLDALAAALLRSAHRQVERRRETVHALARHVRDPRHVLRSLQLRIDELSERAIRAARANTRRDRERLGRSAGQLNALSPLAVLDRGYALARRVIDDAVVRDARQVQINEPLRLTFASGEATVRVESTSGTAAAKPAD